MCSKTLDEIESNHIGDPSLIGVSCESGEFEYCEPDIDNSVPIGCDGSLFFSDSNRSCKKFCETDLNSNRKKRSDSGRKGWTQYFTSTDTPNGTGDHEHYFFYYGNENRDRLAVYDSNGSVYTSCNKTAIDVRERETGKFWWALSKNYTLIFSKFKDKDQIKSEFKKNATSHPEYDYRLKPDYG